MTLRPSGVVNRIAELLPSRSDYAAIRHTWRRDVTAGITVGVVALPLALAFGVSSGVGAAAGLVTAVVAGLVAAVFGGSRVQVSGPTGAMAVVLAPIVAAHGLGSIALVTVMAGGLVAVAGLTGLGRAVTFIPWPVIEGFTLGIAVIIFLQQVPAALGVHLTDVASPLAGAVQAVRRVLLADAGPSIALVALVVGVMLVLPLLHRTVPASLLAVVAATCAAAALDLPVAQIGQLPTTLNAPVLPTVDPGSVRSLLGAALAIAVLAAIESLLSARVAATMSSTGSYHPDRELLGQGLASIASGVFGGMPATGAIARTAVNVKSGAASRLSAIVHSVVLLAVVYLAANLVSSIPLGALSAVLMVTAVRMVSVVTIARILRSTRADAIVLIVTAVITVCFDLIEAVEIGVVVAAFFALRSVSRRSSITREALPGPPQPGDERIALLRLNGAMFFGAAERMATKVISDHRRSAVDVVILAMSRLDVIDATGASAVGHIASELEKHGITVLIKGVQPEHARLLASVGAIEELRHDNHIVASLDEAVAHARSHVQRAQVNTQDGRDTVGP